MNKTLLATLVLSLGLIGCGGGGGSKGGNSLGNNNSGGTGAGNGTVVVPDVDKEEEWLGYSLDKLIDIRSGKDYAAKWYQFNEEPNGNFQLVTHPNFNDPYEFTFKNGKILSKRNSALDDTLEPMYAYNGIILKKEANDTADNENGAQRIGKYNADGIESAIAVDENGQIVGANVHLTYKPYKGDSNLEIIESYEAKKLEGDFIGQVLNPALYEAANLATTSSLITSDSKYKAYLPAVWKAHPSNLANTKFTKGAACLVLRGKESNIPHFYAKSGGSVPIAIRDSFEKNYGLNTFDVNTTSNGTEITIGYKNTDGVIDNRYGTLNTKEVGAPWYTAISYTGQYHTDYVDMYTMKVDQIFDNHEALLAELEESGQTPSVAQTKWLEIQERNAINGCDLYNKAARDQIRAFLTKVHS